MKLFVCLFRLFLKSELAVEHKLALNLGSFCFSFPVGGMTVVCPHSWLLKVAVADKRIVACS